MPTPCETNSPSAPIRGVGLINLSGTDATIRVREDGRMELEGVFLLKIETSALLDRGTTRESRFFDRRDISFSGTSPGTAYRFDLDFHGERNLRIRRTNRVDDSAGPRPSVLGQDAPTGPPDKHETSQGRRTATVEFDPKAGDVLFHVSDGLAAVPDVPWRLRLQQ